MILREPCLSPGWYPRQRGLIEEFLEPFAKDAPPALAGNSSEFSPAAIAPHAGWYYSGLPAAMAVSSLDRDAETVAVIGGHLPSGMPILLAEEEGVKTPLGTMEIDQKLREEFKNLLPSSRPDRYQDNTVEVLLPMVHYFFPRARLLWLRFPADISSFEAGKLLAESAGKLGRRLVVLASTDLTHYGANYGFSPRGRGKPALEWVKKVNDAAFISAVLDADPSSALKHAEEDLAACSAGAVLGALGFSACLGKKDQGKMRARLLDYRTSADVGRDSDEDLSEAEIPDSFVGYASVTLG